MPDNNTPAPKVMVTVSRNNVSLDFLATEKVRGDAVRKPDADGKIDEFYLLKGSMYPSPKVDKTTLQTLIDWLSPDVAAKLLGKYLNQWAQNLTEEVLESTKGTIESLDLSEFAKLAAQFSPRGETIGELVLQREALLAELESITDGAAALAKVQEVAAVSAAIRGKKRGSAAEKAQAAA